MKPITAVLITAALTLTACATVTVPPSKPLTCSARGVTLSVPTNWTVESTGCHFKGPGDIHIVEISPGAASANRGINLVSVVSAAVLKATLKYEEYGERSNIALPNAKGLQRTFKDTAGRNVVQLVIEKDGRFWQLLLQTPMKEWNEQKEQLLKSLHSAEIRSPV
jgi:hypothetical protein